MSRTPDEIGRSDEFYLAMAALDNYPIDDGLPKSTSVVYRIHQLGRALQAAEDRIARVQGRPRIVCLCGSTRFIDLFATATWELELQGHIVLGCTLLPAWFCGVGSHFAEHTGTKDQRDSHHLQKIDLADEVLVLNVGGYVGDSTRNEIAYAERTGKPVRYISDDLALLALITRQSDTALRAGQGEPAKEGSR